MKAMKNKNILIILIAIFFFMYGFSSHKFKIFPYKLLVKIKNFNDQTHTQFKIKDKDLRKILKNQNEMRKKYPYWNKETRLIKYSPGLNIFSDRNYYNHINDDFLEKKYLVQIPRHYEKNLNIFFSNDTLAFRAICGSNENNYIGWEKTEHRVLIISSTCTHQDIYKKYFKKGIYKFEHGGPISSDPIFFQVNNLDDIVEIK
tara:strand:+ start:6510 stop:7115 length:606 start_codon:yes stop_codon:yes gene_type:complete